MKNKSLFILGVACFSILSADGKTSNDDEYEHRINFSIVNIGYECIKPNSLYIGADAQLVSFFSADNKNKDLNHFLNSEFRLGYNYAMTQKDALIPYIGTGFSLFKIEKSVGNVSDWNYGTIGTKYLHRFGEMFEMGIQTKGYFTIQQKRISDDCSKEKTRDTRWMLEIGMPMIWHIGEHKNWEIQLEPYYLQIPNEKITHLVGNRLTFGYRF